MLVIKDLESGYGKVNVLKKINIEVQKNKVVTLIGANGAVSHKLGLAETICSNLAASFAV